jgi:hypothetical protein
MSGLEAFCTLAGAFFIQATCTKHMPCQASANLSQCRRQQFWIHDRYYPAYPAGSDPGCRALGNTAAEGRAASARILSASLARSMHVSTQCLKSRGAFLPSGPGQPIAKPKTHPPRPPCLAKLAPDDLARLQAQQGQVQVPHASLPPTPHARMPRPDSERTSARSRESLGEQTQPQRMAGHLKAACLPLSGGTCLPVGAEGDGSSEGSGSDDDTENLYV